MLTRSCPRNCRKSWTQARRKAKAQETLGSGPLRLIEAVMEGGGSGLGGLVIELPGGGRVRVESPLQLRLAAELLSMMAQSSARGRC